MQVREFQMKLEEDRDGINRRLGEILPPAVEPPAALHEAMRHAALGGGKRLRGVLCRAAHRLFGDPHPEGALDAACALECLHAYTLVHDDLPALDDDDTRRGKPSCHVKFGEATAILAGDALQALAFQTLAGAPAPAGKVLESVRILSETAGSRYLVGGQVADLEGEQQESTPERVEFIHLRKTSQLIAASVGIGACLAGAGEDALASVFEAGRKAGFAFQIVDDILDVEGREDLVGKALRKDMKRGKITHPACYGVEGSRRAAGELIGESIERVRELGDDGYLGQLFSLIIERAS